MELVRRLVEISSPTEDIEACRKVIDEANAILSELLGTPGEVRDVLGRPTLRWGSANPRVLLLTHLDTVWPHGSFEPLWQVSGDVMRGPGVFDMKAGFVQAAYALQSLSDRGGVTLLATTDEETGSECSRALIEEIASGADAVLVFEASLDGKLKTARKGTSMYRVIVEGRAAHAGLDPEKGINATLEIATLYPAILAAANVGVGTTVTPTVLHSGTTLNTVPALAHLDIDVRAFTTAEQSRVHSAITSLAGTTSGGASVRIEGGINRPPLDPSSSARLFAIAKECAEELGLPELGSAQVGGASDGNFTAALGIPTIDGIGAVGEGAHASNEWASAAAIAERAQLAGALIARILAQ
ncbi:MAG: M20 family peptidase [Actinobacteria bacterium]|nr:M20 family peptidase [Actinomycetota bacterium]